jgi:DNA-binding response OmpR family regulator
MLCERCRAELAGKAEALPEGFRTATWTIAGEARDASLFLRRLFAILWRRRQSILSRDQLNTLVYGDRLDPPREETIDVNLLRLRRLIEGSQFEILNHYGEGWQLVAADPGRLRKQKRLRDARYEVGRLRARGMAMLLAIGGSPQ